MLIFVISLVASSFLGYINFGFLLNHCGLGYWLSDRNFIKSLYLTLDLSWVFPQFLLCITFVVHRPNLMLGVYVDS